MTGARAAGPYLVVGDDGARYALERTADGRRTLVTAAPRADGTAADDVTRVDTLGDPPGPLTFAEVVTILEALERVADPADTADTVTRRHPGTGRRVRTIATYGADRDRSVTYWHPARRVTYQRCERDGTDLYGRPTYVWRPDTPDS